MRLLYPFIIFILFSLRLQSQCIINTDFESTAPGSYTAANAISGWTISSQSTSNCTSSSWNSGSPEVQIINTPIFSVPVLGTLPNSPFGGSKVIRLNDNSASGLATKISQTFSTSVNQLFQFAYAGVVEDGNHSCCQQAGITVRILDAAGNSISCYEYRLAGTSTLCSNTTYSSTGNYLYKNWQVGMISLCYLFTPSVTIEVTARDCEQGDHYAFIYFDAGCINSSGTPCPPFVMPVLQTAYCVGSTVAYITAPLGYNNYSWQYSSNQYSFNPIIQNTDYTVAVTNPIPGSTFTVFATSATGCPIAFTTQLNYTPLQTPPMGSYPSCINGTSGSATVGITTAGPYTFTWTNSTGSVVGNNHIATNLLPGTYSVVVQGNGPLTCTTSATVSVGTYTPGLTPLIIGYCGTEAYLNVPGGSNYQWYIGTAAISPSNGGTSPTYTIINPSTSQPYTLSYTSPQGCKDSLRYTPYPVPSGSINISKILMSCPGANSGLAVINLTAAPQSSLSTFSVFNTGTTSIYTSSLTSTTLKSFTTTNMPAGTYSVNVFDGLCKYTASINIATYNNDFTLTPSTNSACSGSPFPVSVILSNPAPSTYSWSPTIFLAGNAGTFSSTIITPTVALNSQTTIVYTVLVTPSVVNCPLAKSMTVHVSNPASPTIVPISNFCSNSPAFSLSAQPSGGLFSGPGIISGNVFSPSIAPVGLNTIQYNVLAGFCFRNSTTTIIVKQAPQLSINGTSIICLGDTISLSASGANAYLWNNGNASPTMSMIPTKSSKLSVTGTSTNGCVSTKTIYVSAESTPTLQFFGNTTICQGDTTALVATGAVNYLWSVGSTTNILKVAPPSTSVYSVTGYNSPLCFKTNTLMVTVKKKPVLAINGPTETCVGHPIVLTALGASTYTWNNSFFVNPLTISPLFSTVITLHGLDTNGCVAKKSLSVSAAPSPTLSVTGETLLCSSQITTITLEGAYDYYWSDITLTGNSQTFQPLADTVLLVTGSYMNGCTATATINLFTNGCTKINESDSDPFKIFPNPFSDVFTIQPVHEGLIKLIDSHGRTVLQQTITRLVSNFSTEHIKPGLYQLIYYHSSGIEKRKVLKIER